MLAEEQYGSRKDHRSAEVLLNTRLVGDSLRQQRKPGIICSNDALLCYDRIVHSLFAICLRRLGAHPKPVESCIRTLQALEHQIKTAFGVSKESYTGNSRKPLQGIAQGYGPAPTGWVAISSPLIEMMLQEGYGHNDWSAILSAALTLVCFAFIDDTDLVNTLPDGEYDINTLISSTQNALDLWKGGLLTTGGTLVPKKSCWYLIDFRCTANGNWVYKKISECPGEMYITQPDGKRIKIDRCEVTEGRKALGAKLRHDGVERENVKWFRSKVALWADKIQIRYLRPELVWKVLRQTVFKSVQYPLAAIGFSPS